METVVTTVSVTGTRPARRGMAARQAGRALDIGERFWIRGLDELILSAAHDSEPHVPDEFLIMALDHPIEPDKLPIQIVQDFYRRRLFREKHLRPPCENFGVAAVLGK